MRSIPELSAEAGGPILRRTKGPLLREFFENYRQRKFLHPAEWFCKAAKWYRLNHAYNNPYNYGTIQSELLLLASNERTLKQHIAGNLLVFWGVGTGDSEMEVVGIHLSAERRVEIVGIDINYQFLGDFRLSLQNKLRENAGLKIFFLGVNDLFEKIKRSDLGFGSAYGSKLHVCLGNTVGNYPRTEEILEIFRKNSLEGDKLLIGFQINRNLKNIFEKYAQNRLFNSFLSDCVPKGKGKRHQLEWKLNKDESQIEAWCDGIQIFRSRKFDPDDIRNAFLSHGFAFKEQITDSFNTCIQVYQCKAN